MIPDEINYSEDPLEFEDELDLEINEEILDEEETDSSDLLEIPREDKIFNNKYNTGDGLTDPDEYLFSKKISVSNEYSDTYLKDIYEYEDDLEAKFILDSIFNFLQNDITISKIIKKHAIDKSPAKIKLVKEEINFIFYKVSSSLELTPDIAMFYSPIYIVEVISSISSIEYKKIFDMLDTEIQELLILELNKKYKFLDGKLHKKKIH